jgi:hypothetical protein
MRQKPRLFKRNSDEPGSTVPCDLPGFLVFRSGPSSESGCPLEPL